jgi:hypothetical protein
VLWNRLIRTDQRLSVFGDSHQLSSERLQRLHSRVLLLPRHMQSIGISITDALDWRSDHSDACGSLPWDEHDRPSRSLRSSSSFGPFTIAHHGCRHKHSTALVALGLLLTAMPLPLFFIVTNGLVDCVCSSRSATDCL